MSGVCSLPAGASPPIRAVWQGVINANSALAVSVDSAGALTATVNGGAATFTSVDGATVQGEIITTEVTVRPSGTIVARAASADWSTTAPADAETAGTIYIPPGMTRQDETRGRGIRRTVFGVAGFADEDAAAVRAPVEVQVVLGLRGLGR